MKTVRLCMSAQICIYLSFILESGGSTIIVICVCGPGWKDHPGTNCPFHTVHIRRLLIGLGKHTLFAKSMIVYCSAWILSLGKSLLQKGLWCPLASHSLSLTLSPPLPCSWCSSVADTSWPSMAYFQAWFRRCLFCCGMGLLKPSM